MMFLLGFGCGILAFLAFCVVVAYIKTYKLKKVFKAAFPEGEAKYKRKRKEKNK